MENKTTDNEENVSLSRDLLERFLYGVVTLVFCIAPFLIPGITMRQGGMLFMGDILLLILGIIVFSLWVNKRKPNTHNKPSRSHH